MKIIKRDQSFQIYDRQKISRAVSAAFESVGHSLSEVQKEVLLDQVEVQIRGRTEDGRAFASNIMTAPLSRILKDGVI